MPSGICTKGAGITVEGASPLMRALVASSHSSGFCGSRLRPTPSALSRMSIGGSRAWSPLAKTDFPVPRPPAITTPPNPGSTAANKRASLSVPWPVMAASGKARVAWSSLIDTPLATMEAFNPLSRQSCRSCRAFEHLSCHPSDLVYASAPLCNQ